MWTLTLLTPSLEDRGYLYVSCIICTCFHLLCSSFLYTCMNSAGNSVQSIQASYLAFLVAYFWGCIFFLSFEQVIFEYQPALVQPCSLQVCILWIPLCRHLDRLKSALQKSNVITLFPLPKLYYLMITEAEAISDFHVSDQFFLFPGLALHLSLLAPWSSDFVSMSCIRYQPKKTHRSHDKMSSLLWNIITLPNLMHSKGTDKQAFASSSRIVLI